MLSPQDNIVKTDFFFFLSLSLLCMMIENALHLPTVNLWSALPFWDRAEAKSNIFIQYPHVCVVKRPISMPAELDSDFRMGERIGHTIPRQVPNNGTQP